MKSLTLMSLLVPLLLGCEDARVAWVDAGSTQADDGTINPDLGLDDTTTGDDGGAAMDKGANVGACTADEKFSFFVVSLEQIKKWGGESGLGGNLGGLAGADAKCQEAAEAAGSCKTWRAFLSVTDDGTGKPVNAIDRIGEGPWYDANGYLVAQNKAGLLQMRPDSADETVYNDGWKDWPLSQCLTTELGNCNLSYGDSHDTLTGSNTEGKLYSTDPKYTCNDWTSTNVDVQLPIGHTWNRRLYSTKQDDAHWIFAHTNCKTGGGPGGPPSGSTSCNGCAANINLSNTFEEGVGGNGGYGAWYCFAID